MKLSSAYLVLYNLASAGGWLYVLVLSIQAYLAQGPAAVWPVVKAPLFVVQTAALLEILHIVVGIVRSPLFSTLMQVASRIVIVWGVLALEGEKAVASVAVTTLMLSWGITEVIRYTFYATKQIDACPYPLLWLRYTTFYVLYISGVASEIAVTVLSLDHIYRTRPLSIDLPNPANWSFDYYWAVLLFLAAYVPFFPYLYSHMIAQRRRYLGKSKKE